MTTKKRFYIEHNVGDVAGLHYLWDLNGPKGPRSLQSGVGRDWRLYLEELCDYLNKGHEATEKEAARQRLYESCLKIESGEIQTSETKPLGPARTWGHENIPPGKRFYRLNNFNGWWDSILILDSEAVNPRMRPVSDFPCQHSEEHTADTSAYVDELLRRLNEATEAER